MKGINRLAVSTQITSTKMDVLLFRLEVVNWCSRKGEMVGISPDRDGNSLRAFLLPTHPVRSGKLTQ